MIIIKDSVEVHLAALLCLWLNCLYVSVKGGACFGQELFNSINLRKQRKCLTLNIVEMFDDTAKDATSFVLNLATDCISTSSGQKWFDGNPGLEIL